MSSISVILAEDHTLVRKGIRSLLEKIPDFKILGEAGNGREVLDMLAEKHADVVLMDIGMPVMNGIEAAARIVKLHSSVRVVMLSMHESEEYLLPALRAGCSGYVLKSAAPAELEFAIRSVARGEYYLSPGLRKIVLDSYLHQKRMRAGPGGKLTPRQREILQLVAEGQTSAQIASKLSLSLKTIEAHRAQIMSRLQIHDVAGLTRFAIRAGLVKA